ncbi:MAG TPA: Gfo/Idh/MocA family oxidoreductase [Verrucomicrobiota bacterium]|nr:Gfo/Idh/MocA family oxidoreductase [Verrucomicrobiota bacterium]HNU52851.1 Gfo/Idh/MocA family oxidoreductase [Verrucomicrobiota bacterium]
MKTPDRSDSAGMPGAPVGGRLWPRRTFLQRSAAVAALGALPAWMPGLTRGGEGTTRPSERVTVGLIGRGLMGSGHLRRLAGDPGFQLVAVCDADRTRREEGRAIVDEHYAAAKASGAYRGCAAYADYRELLAREDIDAVLIATPDHWHAYQAIDAARAGKDIYAEKPVSVTLEEGRRLVQAVQRYGRVFQTGTQYRSIPTIRRVCQFIREGGLGRVQSVFTPYQTLAGWLGSDRFRPYAAVVDPAVCGKSYVPLDFALPAEPVPEGLAWDLWVGPAPWRPYNSLYHINPAPGVVPWSFCDAFGVTSSTWFLSHAADVIQYALGMERSGPVELIHPSAGEFPTLTFRYANGTLLHFVDHWGVVKDVYHAVPASARLTGNFGGVFVGERGWVTSMSAAGPIEGGPEDLMKALGLATLEVNIGANDHHANWLRCIRTRQAPSADEEIGHRSSSIGLLANLACILGRSLRWDPVLEEFPGDAAANRLRARSPRAPWRL